MPRSSSSAIVPIDGSESLPARAAARLSQAPCFGHLLHIGVAVPLLQRGDGPLALDPAEVLQHLDLGLADGVLAIVLEDQRVDAHRLALRRLDQQPRGGLEGLADARLGGVLDGFDELQLGYLSPRARPELTQDRASAVATVRTENMSWVFRASILSCLARASVCLLAAVA